MQEIFDVDIAIEKCPAYHDNRGDLIQFITNQLLTDKATPFGQIYLLTFNGKGIIRGNHYHNHSSEIFCLISGTVEMQFVDVETKQILSKTFTADSNEFYRVYIGAKIAHAIKSLSDFAVMVSFSSKEYDIKDHDKIAYPLI